MSTKKSPETNCRVICKTNVKTKDILRLFLEKCQKKMSTMHIPNSTKI